MPYDSESKGKKTKPIETQGNSVDETFQWFGQDEADAPRPDEREGLSVRPKAGSGKNNVLSFICEEHLREAQEFMRKGYNSQIPRVDPELVAKLREVVTDTRSRIGLRTNVEGPLGSQWLLKQLGYIEYFTDWLSKGMQEWVEHEVPGKRWEDSGETKLESRRTAQSLVRRLESLLQTLIRIAHILRAVDDYSTPERRLERLVTELTSAFSPGDEYVVMQALERMTAEAAGDEAWSSLLQARAVAWEAGGGIGAMVQIARHEAEKANKKARVLLKEPQAFFSEIAAYLQSLSCEMAKASVNVNQSASLLNIQAMDDEVAVPLSRSDPFTLRVRRSFVRKKCEFDAAVAGGEVLMHRLLRSVKYGDFKNIQTKDPEKAITDSIIRSILWQWQQSAIKIQYASGALLAKVDELKKIEGILLSSTLAHNRGNEAGAPVIRPGENDVTAQVRQWVNDNLAQEKNENQLAAKVAVLKQLLSGDIDHARSLLARQGDTKESIQEGLENQWRSVNAMLKTDLSVDAASSLWATVDSMVDEFMPYIARELATAASALNDALLAAGHHSACNFSLASAQANKAQLLATKVKEKISAESARLTERPLDEYSRSSRLAKHWAKLAREQNLSSYPPLSAKQVFSSLNKKGLQQGILPAGDPTGYLFATRLANELENARSDELRLPMSPEQYVALEKGFVEYIVKWSQRRTTRGATRIVIELSFEQALDAVTFKLSSLARVPYKILKAAIKIPYKVNKVVNYTMPGEDKPYKAIFVLLEKKLKQLGFSLVMSPVPGIFKLAVGAGVTAGTALYNLHTENREKTFSAVYQRVAEGRKSEKIKMDSPWGMLFDVAMDASSLAVYKGIRRDWLSEERATGMVPAQVQANEYFSDIDEQALSQAQPWQGATGNDGAAWRNAAVGERDTGPVNLPSSLLQQADIPLFSEHQTPTSGQTLVRPRRAPPGYYRREPGSPPVQSHQQSDSPSAQSHQESDSIHNSGPTKTKLPYKLKVTWADKTPAEYLHSFANPVSTLAEQTQVVVSAIKGETIEETMQHVEQAEYIGSWFDVTAGVVTSFTPAGWILGAAQSAANISADLTEDKRPDPLAVTSLIMGSIPGGRIAAKVGKFTQSGGKAVKYGVMLGNKTVDLAIMGESIKTAVKTGEPLAIYQAVLSTGMSTRDSYAMTKKMSSTLGITKTMEESTSLRQLKAIQKNPPEKSLPVRTFKIGSTILLGKINHGEIEVSEDNGATWGKGNKLHLLAYKLQNAGGSRLLPRWGKKDKIVIGAHTFEPVKYDKENFSKMNKIAKDYIPDPDSTGRKAKILQDYQSGKKMKRAPEYDHYNRLTFDEKINLFIQPDTDATTRGVLAGKINKTIKKINAYNAAQAADAWKLSAKKATDVILVPQNIYLKGRPGVCLPVVILMGRAVQKGQGASLANKLMDVYSSSDIDADLLYKSLVDLYANGNTSKFSEPAISGVSLRTLASAESKLFPTDNSSVRVDIPGHTMSISKMNKDGKVKYVFYDPNYGLAYFKSYRHMVGFFKKKVKDYNLLEEATNFKKLNYSHVSDVKINGRNLDEIIDGETNPTGKTSIKVDDDAYQAEGGQADNTRGVVVPDKVTVPVNRDSDGKWFRQINSGLTAGEGDKKTVVKQVEHEPQLGTSGTGQRQHTEDSLSEYKKTASHNELLLRTQDEIVRDSKINSPAGFDVVKNVKLNDQWSLTNVNLKNTNSDTAINAGSAIYVTFTFTYTNMPSKKAFTESPWLQWNEKIKRRTNNEIWEFEHDMYVIKPKSPTFFSWRNRYIEAYHYAQAADKTAFNGNVKFFDKTGKPLSSQEIGKTDDQEQMALNVKNYLAEQGGILEVTIIDVPSVSKREELTINDRIVNFSIGFDSEHRIKFNQGISVSPDGNAEVFVTASSHINLIPEHVNTVPPKNVISLREGTLLPGESN